MSRHWGSWLVRAGAAGALLTAVAVAPQVAGAQEHGGHDGDMDCNMGMDMPEGMVCVGPGGDGQIPDPPEGMAWSDDQLMKMHDLIDRTKAELPAFADAQHDLDLGFYDFGVDAPGGWVHYINWAWMSDSHVLDPTHPESLVFHRENDGSLKLVSAMFFATLGTKLDTIPEEIHWYPGWHTHHDVCIRDDDHKFGGLTSGDTCPEGSKPFDDPPMMHVWVAPGPCEHSFGGIDIGGVHCTVMGMPMGDDMPPMTTMPPPTTQPGGPTPPPAHPIEQTPPFTG